MNKATWALAGLIKLRRKTEGKGNMKIVCVCVYVHAPICVRVCVCIDRFKDEIFGLGYNHLPKELWDKFNRVRQQGKHDRPALVHWEYGKEDDVDEDGNKVKGYFEPKILGFNKVLHGNCLL